MRKHNGPQVDCALFFNITLPKGEVQRIKQNDKPRPLKEAPYYKLNKIQHLK